MTRGEFDVFLNAGVGVCAIMIVVSLLRFKSRGISAYFLALSFAGMGGVLYGLGAAWPQPAIVAFAVLVGLGIVADFVVRSAQRQDKG